MTWLAIVGLAWVAVALFLAVVMGRGIRQADDREQVSRWVTEVDGYVRAAAQRQLATTSPAPRHATD